MNIRGKLVLLRAIEDGDLPRLHEWSNDPEIWPLLGGWHFPGSAIATRKWFESLAGDPLNQRFAITTPELGVVGTANLVEIDWKNRHAFHGMMLGEPSCRGRGIGTDTIMAIMRYAFDELGFVRLDGSMIEYNQASLRTYCERCGWKIEGRQRNWYFRNGRFWDRVLVGITREDYAEHCAANSYWDRQ